MKKLPQVKPTRLDRFIGYWSPRAFNSRVSARLKMAMAEQTGYVHPGSAKKTMKGVVATPNSPDRDMAPKVKGSRALSRDMFMNSPVAVAAIRRVRTNVVGSGLMPQPIIDWEYLGLTKEKSEQWEKQASREFHTWADSPNCDFSRRQNFWDLQASALLSTFLNGDVFPMYPWKQIKNWPYELRIKLVEADLVRNPDNIPEYLQKKIVSGFRSNKQGEIISAFFMNSYEYDYPYSLPSWGKEGYTEIQKYSKSGRQNWYQLFEPERVGQRRGMPWLAPVLDTLKSVSRLSDAELTGALIASMFTVFIKDQSSLGSTLNEPYTPMETVGGGGTVTDSEGNQVTVPKDVENGQDLELGAGMIHYLDEDKEIQIADPKRPNDAFEPFFQALVTEIGAAIEVPAEQLLLKFNTSYSAARAALLEAWKFWKRRRTWLVREFCQVVYSEFITECVIKGRLSAPGFFDDPTIKAAWVKAIWTGPGMGQIDPLKEAKASVLKVGANLSSHQEEYMADKGGNWEESMERKSREKNVLDGLGLESNLKPKELTGPDGVEDPEEVDQRVEDLETEKESK